MDHLPYADPGDRRYVRNLRTAAPTEFQAYRNFSDTVVGRTDGAVPPKYRELIAVAVALTTQCAYCIESHTAKAHQAGVSEEELAEVVYLAAALRAGGAAAHGMMAMRMFHDHSDTTTASTAAQSSQHQ